MRSNSSWLQGVALTVLLACQGQAPAPNDAPEPSAPAVADATPDAKPPGEKHGSAMAEAAASALEVGAKAPPFTLPDSEGGELSLDALRARGPALLVFYRGHW